MRYSRFSEYVLFGLAFLWGAWLIIFCPFDRAAAYSWLAEAADEWIWGGVFCALGLLALLVRNSQARRQLHAMAFIAWLLVALGMALGDFRNTAAIVYISLAVQHAGHFWRTTELYDRKSP
jgi:hypothetical protein